jgi:ribosomal protein S18 acetylase RimI-like enzyme
MKTFEIRPYQPSDRDAVRALCCDTGFLGTPIDPVFEDRELFANFLTDYYLDCESDSAFVVMVKNQISGYLLGARFPVKHKVHSFFQGLRDLFKLFIRYPGYNKASKHYIHWLLLNAWREVPAAPKKVGHFHINLLPEARSIEICREMLETYLRFLHEHHVAEVFGQMVTFDNRRTFRLFERYGFSELNRSEITKFRQFTDKKVYLSTVYKKIEPQKERLLYQVRD